MVAFRCFDIPLAIIVCYACLSTLTLLSLILSMTFIFLGVKCFSLSFFFGGGRADLLILWASTGACWYCSDCIFGAFAADYWFISYSKFSSCGSSKFIFLIFLFLAGASEIVFWIFSFKSILLSEGFSFWLSISVLLFWMSIADFILSI